MHHSPSPLLSFISGEVQSALAHEHRVDLALTLMPRRKLRRWQGPALSDCVR